MAVSLILAKKILSLLFMLFLGVLLVRLNVLKSEDSKSLSVLSLYLIIPCLNLQAFQVQYNASVRNGLLLAFIAALLVELLMVLAAELLSRIVPMDPVEKTSAIYSNAGNMVIPIVTSMLGAEYVIYTMAYSSVQQFLFWSHCKMTICGERKIEFRKIFCNVNMAAILLGLAMFLLRIQFPLLIQETLSSVGNTVGPISMIITGMLIGGMDLKKVFTYRRVWLVTGIRLLAFPLLSLLLLKFTPLATALPDGNMVLMITLLAASAPTAATVTQMAQVYGQDADYASACSVVTTLLCAVTMPLLLLLYQI